MRALLITRLDARDPANAIILHAAGQAGLSAELTAGADGSISPIAQPVVVVVAPDIGQPAVVARQVLQFAPKARMVFVRHPGEPPASRLPSQTQLIGTQWEVAPLEPAPLSATLSRAARTVQQQLQLRTTLDRINIHLKEHGRPDPVDHRRLLLSDRFLSALFTASPDVIVAAEPNGRVVLWNQSAADVTGVSARDAVGQNVAERLGGSSRRAITAGVEAVVAGAEQVKTQLSLGAGSQQFEALIVAVRAAEQQDVAAVLIVARDVSERERLEQALRTRAEELEVAGRQKDEFLMTLSHELRTPLNAIFGWALLMQRGVGDRARGVDVIVRNTQALRRLVEDLLDVAGIVGGKTRLHIQTINPSASVAAAVDAVAPSANAKELGLEVAIDPGAGPVAADPDRLQQIAWNLLSNAIKFTPKGGRVHLRLENVGAFVELLVTDTGAGIDPSFLPFVFDRFRQQDAGSSRAFGGLGLGLAIVKQLAELHGGHVTAESPGLGNGATFRVRLPILAEWAEAAPPGPPSAHSGPATPPVSATPLEGVSVMVVDDEPDSRELVTIILERAGATVTAAISAEAALERLRTAPPMVLVSDIEMPGTDGYSLIGQLRATISGRALPAIALTASARTEDRMRALRSGFQAHVAKPCDPAALTALVAALAKAGDQGRDARE